jgi:hypothetical protein
MQSNRILDTLRSPNATLAVLVLALIAQLPHAADVFRLIVHGVNWGATLHSYSFAIALELAVLLFVVQNRHAESYGFAAVSIAMNLSYYYLHDVQLLHVAAMPALLVSVALPVAIARYSHAVADGQTHMPDVQPPAHILPDNGFSPAINHAVVQIVRQEAEDAQRGELVVYDDTLMDVRSRIADLQSEGFDAKWIATKELHEIAGTQLAELLNVDASTISRWRKKAKAEVT